MGFEWKKISEHLRTHSPNWRTHPNGISISFSVTSVKMAEQLKRGQLAVQSRLIWIFENEQLFCTKKIRPILWVEYQNSPESRFKAVCTIHTVYTYMYWVSGCGTRPSLIMKKHLLGQSRLHTLVNLISTADKRCRRFQWGVHVEHSRRYCDLHDLS